MSYQVAIYPASFDPPTNGHEWMIETCHKMFDLTLVGVAQHPSKRYTFTQEERIEMLDHIIAPSLRNDVRIMSCGASLTAHFAKTCGAQLIVRGLRSATDFDYERQMQQVNRDIDPSIQTIFLPPPENLEKISSSLVKGMCLSAKWEKEVARYVHPFVMEKLRGKFKAD